MELDRKDFIKTLDQLRKLHEKGSLSETGLIRLKTYESLENLILCEVSITFKEKILQDIEVLKQEYKEIFDNTEMAINDDTWSPKITVINKKIKALSKTLNDC